MTPISKSATAPAGPLDLVGRLVSVLGLLETGLSWISALILALLLALVLTAVGLRYLFGSGFIWSEELAIWLNVVLVAVGSPLAVTGALAMRFDVIVRLFPQSIQKIASILADAIAIDAGLILAFGGGDVVAAIGGTSTALALPEWLRYAAVAIGGGLTVLVLVGRAFVQSGLPRAAAILAIGCGCYLAAHHLHGPLLETPSLTA